MTAKASFFAGFALMLGASGMALAQPVDAPPAPSPPSTIEPAVQTPPAPVATPAPSPATAPAPAPAPVKPPAPKKKGPVDSLKPGQYVWEARAKDAKDLRIIAVLDIQRLYVFDGDSVVGVATISTGKKGNATPSGVFKILQKNVDHKSNLYSNAPMPYMQRLTWDGIALHAGHNPGYAASHGCIRLPMGFARALYGVTKMDQPVVILASLDAPKPAPKPDEKPVTPVTPPPEVQPAPQPLPQSTPQPTAEPVAPVTPTR